MVVNLWKTAAQGNFLANEADEAPALSTGEYKAEGEYWHRWIERKPVQMLVLSLLMVAIGGLFELVPTFLVKSNIPTISSVKPYTPLELEGRDLYIREGCYTCHSQMIRPFRSETERYGEYSKAGEFVYDHPFQWGSKRTGPDLHRIGGKYPDSWHFNHMLDPRTMSPGSIMPAYPWLITDDLDMSLSAKKIDAMRTLGVPYAPEFADELVYADMDAQAIKIVESLANDGIETDKNKEIVALIAYLQRMGTDIKAQTAQN
jgi:cytochrome c oxidase cbb3-type subunit I/II